MALQIRLEPQIRQTQTQKAALIQLMKFLQLTNQELTDRILAEMVENPLLVEGTEVEQEPQEQGGRAGRSRFG